MKTQVATTIAILVICILGQTSQGWIQSASFSSASSRVFQRTSLARNFLYRSLDDHEAQNSTLASNGDFSVPPSPPSIIQVQVKKEAPHSSTTNSPNDDKNDNSPPSDDDSSSITTCSSSSLGDIMHSLPPPTGPPLFKDGLVTSPTQSLSNLYGITDPLDRMAITANGNLQRLFSSYYDAPVFVVMDYCRPTTTNTITDDCESSSPDDKCWDRRVHLTVHNQTFCTADSFIRVHNVECQALVESGHVGLGQLFRYLDILPEFELLEAGPTPQGGCWRKYTLSCKYVTCHIQEVFVPGAWKIAAVCGVPQIDDES
jgi:chorismate-pyruvate lyase